MDLVEFLAARLDEDEANAPMAGAFAWRSGYPEDRLLREVEAKRAIVAEIKAVKKLLESTSGKPDRYRDWLLRQLAAVYSDHPDYRPEWVQKARTKPAREGHLPPMTYRELSWKYRGVTWRFVAYRGVP